MLHGARVLIVEDEAMIALFLSTVVEDADGCVVGSCETIGTAMALLDRSPPPEVGILDFRLPDGEVTPVAERLLDARIPVVLHTASQLPASLLARAPHLAHCPKPASAGTLLEALRLLLGLNGPLSAIH